MLHIPPACWSNFFIRSSDFQRLHVFRRGRFQLDFSTYWNLGIKRARQIGVEPFFRVAVMGVQGIEIRNTFMTAVSSPQ